MGEGNGNREGFKGLRNRTPGLKTIFIGFINEVSKASRVGGPEVWNKDEEIDR